MNLSFTSMCAPRFALLISAALICLSNTLTASRINAKLRLTTDDKQQIIEACSHAHMSRPMDVTPRGANMFSTSVSFLSRDELISYKLPPEMAGYAFFSTPSNEVIVIELKGPSVSNQLDYLIAFVPTGSVDGVDISREQGSEWRLTAQWPAPKKLHGPLHVGELKALERDDRLGAAEIRMMLGDKKGCLRHMRIVKRNYLRMGDRVSALRLDGFFLRFN